MLVLATGALAVALLPLLDSSPPPARDAAPSNTAEPDTGPTEVAARSGQVVTVALALEDGWTVPEVDDPAGDGAGEIDSAEGEGHDHGLPPLPVGSDTVGAAIDIRRGSESFVVRSATGRDLAFRAGTDGRWGPWQLIGIGIDEGPDGLRGSEGGDSGTPAATPILIEPGAARIQLVDRRGESDPIDIIFLPGFDGPSGDLDEPASPSLARSRSST
ncbi:MAG: hypothetical protein AAFO29_06685, partial [Actinomycetota bacterium]